MQVFDDISKPDMWLKENGIALCVLIDEVAWEDFLLFVAFSCKYHCCCFVGLSFRHSCFPPVISLRSEHIGNRTNR